MLLGANQKNIMDHYAVFSDLMPSFYPPDFMNEIDQINSNPHSISANLDAMRTWYIALNDEYCHHTLSTPTTRPHTTLDTQIAAPRWSSRAAGCSSPP